MDELNSRFKNCLLFLLLLMAVFICFIDNANGKETIFLNKVIIEQAPCLVKLYVSREAPSKFIKIDTKEVLLALKNVVYEKGLKIIGSKGSLIKAITLKSLEGNVVAVLISGNRNFEMATARFNKSKSCFIITLEKTGSNFIGNFKVKQSKKAVSMKRQYKVIEPKVRKIKDETGNQKPQSKPEPENRSEENTQKFVKKTDGNITKTKGYHPVTKSFSRYSGNISDILLKIDLANCKSGILGKVLSLLKNKQYKNSLDLLEKFFLSKNPSCLEQASYLRAFAYYKFVKIKEPLKLVQAEHFFHDALVKFPDSKLKPFGFTAIGLIQLKINNPAVAEGYLTIVKDKYKGYSGLAEVYYFLAGIYKDRGFNEKALRYYKKVFEEMPDNTYTADAGIGYGNTLFDKRYYLDSLNIFKYIVKQNKEKIYTTSKLLYSMGNANFKLGRTSEARKDFTRVINLFPEIKNKDIIFCDIADTYAIENNIDKAKSMYSFVREKFPDEKGFIRSSIGLARYLKDRKAREKLYTMVKTKFPESRFARVAMMRLAEIYQDNKEFEACINEIEELLSTNPMGLRYEAVRLMQKAYEALFKKALKDDNYTLILKKYEENFVHLDRMTSREISLNVGLSYLRGDLYEQSFNHLISAYKLYKRSKRPPELLFGLGVAMDETGRDDDAVKLLKGFVRRFPKDLNTSEAFFRMAEIYLSKNKYKESGGMFERAYKVCKDPIKKSEILIGKAKFYEKQQEWAKVTYVLANAVQDIMSASGKHHKKLSSVYRSMGNAYVKQHVYVRAAESFSEAVKFSETGAMTANLKFMMGDAYQKANVIKEAKKVFKNIVKQDDSVWARLAEQRLSTLALAENAKRS